MKRIFTLGPALLAVAAMTPAFAAANFTGSAAGYLFHERVEASVVVPNPFPPPAVFKAEGSDSSIGIGVRGHLMFTEQLFGSLEIQDAELTSFRLTGGAVLPINPATQGILAASFVDKDADDGIGLHGGVSYQANPQVEFTGLLGYLLLGDFDGLEATLGGRYRINRELSLIGDLRLFTGSDDNDVDFDTRELRLGIAYDFTLNRR